MDRFEGKLIMDDTSSKSIPDKFFGSATFTVMTRGLSPGIKGMGEVEISRIFNGGGLYRRFLRLAATPSTNAKGEAKAIITVNMINRFHLMVERIQFNSYLLGNTVTLAVSIQVSKRISSAFKFPLLIVHEKPIESRWDEKNL